MMNLEFRKGEKLYDKQKRRAFPFFRKDSRIPSYAVGQEIVVSDTLQFHVVLDRFYEEHRIKYILDNNQIVNEDEISEVSKMIY